MIFPVIKKGNSHSFAFWGKRVCRNGSSLYSVINLFHKHIIILQSVPDTVQGSVDARLESWTQGHLRAWHPNKPYLFLEVGTLVSLAHRWPRAPESAGVLEWCRWPCLPDQIPKSFGQVPFLSSQTPLIQCCNWQVLWAGNTVRNKDEAPALQELLARKWPGSVI